MQGDPSRPGFGDLGLGSLDLYLPSLARRTLVRLIKLQVVVICAGTRDFHRPKSPTPNRAAQTVGCGRGGCVCVPPSRRLDGPWHWHPTTLLSTFRFSPPSLPTIAFLRPVAKAPSSTFYILDRCGMNGCETCHVTLCWTCD